MLSSDHPTGVGLAVPVKTVSWSRGCPGIHAAADVLCCLQTDLSPARRGFWSATHDKARLEEGHGGTLGHCLTRMKGERRW
jgi:hypothetical protein